jgi:hypothetical protein
MINTWHICRESRSYSDSPGRFLPLARSWRGAPITGVVFRALRSGVALDGLVAPVTAPCAVWDARPARGLHRRRPPRPEYEPTTHFHTSLCPLSTWGPGWPHNLLTSNVWSVHLVATTSHLYEMRPVNGLAVSWAKGAPPGHPVLRNHTMVYGGFNTLLVLIS